MPTSLRSSIGGQWFEETEGYWFDQRRPIAELAYFQALRLGLVTNRKQLATAGRPVVLGTVAFFLYNFLKGNQTRQGKVLKSCPRYNEKSLANILSKMMSQTVTRDQIRAAKRQLVHFQLIEIKKNKNPRWGYQHRIVKLRGGNHKLKWQDVFFPHLLQRHEAWKEIMEVHAMHTEESKDEQFNIDFNIDNLRPCSLRESVTYGTDNQWAIEAFKSVGVTRLDFFLSPQNGNTKRAKSRRMAQLLKTAITKQQDLYARPYGVPLIMLDEVKTNELDQLRPFAFFCQETSPRNYQVWLRLPETTSDEKRNSIRDRLIKKFNPAGRKNRMNAGSYGSLRWPDSINWKPQHNSFHVRIEFSSYGRIALPEELDQGGLLAPRTIGTNRVVNFTKRKAIKSTRDYWLVFPDWEFFKTKKNGHRSRADAAFIWECLQRGFTPEEIKDELRKVSPKVQEEQSRRSDKYLDHQIQYVLRKVNSGKVAQVA